MKKSKDTFWMTRGALAFVAAASLSLTACEDDEDTQTDAGVEADASTTAETEQYLVIGSVTLTDDTSQTFITTTSSLDSSASFTLGSNYLPISASNNRIAVGPNQDGTFYVGSGESAELTKYTVNQDGSFTKGGSLSFAAHGISSLDGTRNPFQFVSDTKAYYIDTRVAKVVIWNPSEMTITSSVDIENLVPEGLTMSDEGGNFVHQSGTRFLTSVRFLTYEDGSPTGASPISNIIVIDTQDDSVSVISENVCGHVAFSATNDNGDVYFASHSVQALWVEAGRGGADMTAPCIVRVENGADAIDPDYLLPLNSLFDRPTGALKQGAGDTAYTLVLTEDGLTGFTADPSIRTYLVGSYWQYAAITLDSDDEQEATLIPTTQIGLSWGFGGGFTTEVGTAATPFLIANDSAEATGTIYDVTDKDNFVKGLTVTGGTISAAHRVR